VGSETLGWGTDWESRATTTHNRGRTQREIEWRRGKGGKKKLALKVSPLSQGTRSMRESRGKGGWGWLGGEFAAKGAGQEGFCGCSFIV